MGPPMLLSLLLPSLKWLYKTIIDAKNPLRDCDCCVFVHISKRGLQSVLAGDLRRNTGKLA